MANIFRLRSPRQLPVGPVKIDWSHPLTVGLVFCGIDNGGQIVDLVQGRPGQVNSSYPPRGMGQGGPAYNWANGSESGVSWDPLPLNTIARGSSGSGASASLVFVVTASSSNPTGLTRTANNTHDFGVTVSGLSPATVALYDGASTAADSTTVKPNVLHVAVGTNAVGPDNAKLYVDNVVSTSFSSNPSPTTTAPHKILWATKNSDLTFGEFGGLVYSGCFWTRALNPSEVAQYTADPYCFLIPAEGEIPALYNPVVLATGFNPPARRQWALLPRRGIASATKLPRGITAYWPLDAATCEFSSTSGQVRPLDLIGNNYGVDAKSSGAAGRPPTDGDGIGYSFDATNNTYCILNSDPLQGVTGASINATFAMWVYLRAFSGSNGGLRLFQCSSQISTVIEDGAQGTGASIGTVMIDSAWQPTGFLSSGVLTLNNWCHLAYTLTAGVASAIYINGVASILTSYAGGASTSAVNALGSRDNANRIMNGKLAHAMVCQGTVLTASEIADLYSSFFVAEDIMPMLFTGTGGPAIQYAAFATPQHDGQSITQMQGY